jgi:environmental stress-induced protein Ves
MPWKNGRGVTSEIAISPESADFLKLDFDWRLSSAKVAVANSFSAFPNYDRILTIIAGEGLRLNGLDLRQEDVYRFAGEASIDAQMIGGEVVDLGIIFKRNAFHGDMKFIEINSEIDYLINKGSVQIADVAQSACFLQPLQNGIFVDECKLDLLDIYKIEGGGTVKIKADSYPVKILEVTINPIVSNRQI